MKLPRFQTPLSLDEERIRGPLVSLLSENHSIIEGGVIDRSVDFVKRNIGGDARLEGARRHVEKEYPLEAVREAVVNAVVHRDYTRDSTEIQVFLYKDRLEIVSPGGLYNGVTIDKIKQGIISQTRNALLRNILIHYGYAESFGMEIRNRIISSMRKHNGTDPEFIAPDNHFVVRLLKSPKKS